MTPVQLKQELIAELSDSVVNAVGVAFKDATNTTEYHAAIEAARKRLGLPPWHLMTMLAKLQGVPLISGANYAVENLWLTSKSHDKKAYTPKFQPGHENDWVTFDVVGEYRGALSDPIRVSVHPESGLIWNHTTEYPAKQVIRVRFSGVGGKTHSMHTTSIIKEAEKLLYGDELGDTIPVVTCHIRAVGQSRKSSSPEESVEDCEKAVAQDAATMIEAPAPVMEVAASAAESYEKDTAKLTPVAQVVANTKVVYPEDIEAITTMFEFASVLAANMGVKATVERWKKLVDGLRNKEPLTNE